MESPAKAQLDWSEERLLPAFQPPTQLTIYDVHDTTRELQLTLSTVVGLLNRPQPRIYLLWRKNDALWLDEAFASIPQTISPLRNEEILHELFINYPDTIEGLIIYDPALPDSVNVATIMAGLYDCIIVSPEQAAAYQQPPYVFPVRHDLRTYHWSNRLQAYQWAYQNLLPLCSKRLLAGMDPANALGIRSFLVASKTFIYWLNPLGFTPYYSQGWQSEYGLMRRILHAYRGSAVHLGWFVQEGSGVTMTSRVAMPVICTDYFSNLEVWNSVTTASTQPAASIKSQPITPEKKIYLSFTFSEGDNLQYIQERMLDNWSQSERGSLPLGWPITLALPEAAPEMLSYYQRTATPNDEFIGAPSGLAYLYPSKWPNSQLESLLQRTGKLMQQLHLSLLQVLDSNYWWHPLLIYRALTTGSGLVLFGHSLQRHFARTLQQFGVTGILSGGGLTSVSWKYRYGIPIYQNLGTAKSVAQAVQMIQEATPTIRPYFINLYVLAWQLGPKELQEVVKQLGSDYEVVAPSTLLKMLPPEEN
jgi:GxGYxYP putative glycoside hydrolase C-terminal domain/GxGYxY sequence motif in domain of unknown function N-terminal